MFGSGYMQIAKVRGAPIRVHFTVPILCLFASGWSFRPGAWIGVLVVVLAHELGHASLAWRARLRVREVMLHGFGGHCAYVGAPSPLERSIVATGGVLAQLALFALALALEAALGAGGVKPPDLALDLLATWTSTNLAIAAFNLIPLPGLDGAEIWKLPGLLRALRRRRAMNRAGAPSSTRTTTARADAARARPGAPHDAVDEDAVRETVRRALEEARRRDERRDR